MKAKLSAAILILTALFLQPCSAAEPLPLPKGAVYKPDTEETGVDLDMIGVYLLSGEGPAELWIDGIRMEPGEARTLAGGELFEIRPLSDGVFKAEVRYILLDSMGGIEQVTLAYSFGDTAAEKPQAIPCSLTLEKGQEIIGRLAADSDYGETEYILLSSPRKGRVDVKGEEFTYYPYDDASGSDSFLYAAVDKLGRVSSPAKIRLFIEAGDGVFKGSQSAFSGQITEALFQ